MASTKPSKTRKRLFAGIAFLIVIISVSLVLVVAEYIAASMEMKPAQYAVLEHPVAGWLPKSGKFMATTEEFDVHGSVNSLNMNDREWQEGYADLPSRILAVGDSHTFAVGASSNEAWPKRVEAALFGSAGPGVVMNAGVIGYSLGQYLSRYRMLQEKIKPTFLLVGFSMATDLYDLVPPERGGFVYGKSADRFFFDIDPAGKLWERVYRKAEVKSANISFNQDISGSLRGFLQELALYRLLKRSDLAMMIATYYRPGGKSLWPGMDTALKKNLSEDDRYRWRLAELIIAQMASEARARNAKIAVINIPYIPQVYDEVWEKSFGRRPKIYDRYLGSKRLKQLCERHGVIFIDTMDAFVSAARERKHWLHWPVDGHPTPEGHQVIADTVSAELKKYFPAPRH